MTINHHPVHSNIDYTGQNQQGKFWLWEHWYFRLQLA